MLVGAKGFKRRDLEGFALAVFGGAVVTCESVVRCELLATGKIALAVQNPFFCTGRVRKAACFTACARQRCGQYSATFAQTVMQTRADSPTVQNSPLGFWTDGPFPAKFFKERAPVAPSGRQLLVRTERWRSIAMGLNCQRAAASEIGRIVYVCTYTIGWPITRTFFRF